MRRAWGTVVVVSLFLGLLPSTVAAGDSRFFPETGQSSSNAFYEFWLMHGQTEILGYPLSPVLLLSSVSGQSTIFTGSAYQYYERAALEWHPENTRENRVELTRLGANGLEGTQSLEGQAERKQQALHAPPRLCNDNSNCETFDATSHTLAGVFRDYWYGHGGLAIFGYPLTELVTTAHPDNTSETFLAQYFERFVFEWHPEINGGSILLERLGATAYRADLSIVQTLKVVQVPDYDSTLPYLPA